MKLSIVATLYQSAPYINEFYERASATAKQLVGDDYEIVLVNDGSPDNSLDLAIKLTEQDLHVVVVDLSRNFGHHKANQIEIFAQSNLRFDPKVLYGLAGGIQGKSSKKTCFYSFEFNSFSAPYLIARLFTTYCVY